MNPTIKGFIKKELSQTLGDVRMKAMIFVAPLLELAIFGLALSSEVRNIKLGVVCSPSDMLGRRIEERAAASGWFNPVILPADAQRDYASLLKSSRAEAVLVLPSRTLARDAARQDADVQLIIDASNASRARQVEQYVKNILSEVQGGAQSASVPLPVSLSVRVLFNPAMESSYFMVPGVLGLILCLTTIIVTAMSIAQERETGTIETLISAPVENWEILAGKTIPYMLIAAIEMPIVITAAVLIFGVPVRGPLWQLALLGLAFIFAMVNVGVLISTFVKNQQQAMMGSFMFMFPAILISGVMFPVENIPAPARVLAYLNPLTYFIRCLRNIMLVGGDWTVFWQCFGALFIIGGIVSAASSARFTQRLN